MSGHLKGVRIGGTQYGDSRWKEASPTNPRWVG